MRVLHTSDWHLGRSLHGVGMLGAQAAYVDHVLDVVATEQVDLVLVSGDVYDRALPPVDAVELAGEAFARLAASRARVVVTSGNHDSPVRLGFNAALADAAGFHLRTRWQDVAAPVLVEDCHGRVAVYGIPYLEPDAVRQAWQLPARTHEAAMGAAVARVRADLATRGGVRSVVLAHAFVAGSVSAATTMRSASERDISVGGLSLVPTRLFDGFCYAALGHLHGRQTLTDTIRYSGSPLAYSFSEANHTKGSWLVDLGRDGVESADFVPAPVPRRLGAVRGRIDEMLADPSLGVLEECWLHVTLTDAVRPRQAMERLQSRFPHTLLLDFQPQHAAGARIALPPRVDTTSDLDVALGFIHEVRRLEATTEETLLLQLACDSCRIEADAESETTVGRASETTVGRGSEAG